jgi:hypothetical protein
MPTANPGYGVPQTTKEQQRANGLPAVFIAKVSNDRWKEIRAQQGHQQQAGA